MSGSASNSRSVKGASNSANKAEDKSPPKGKKRPEADAGTKEEPAAIIKSGKKTTATPPTRKRRKPVAAAGIEPGDSESDSHIEERKSSKLPSEIELESEENPTQSSCTTCTEPSLFEQMYTLKHMLDMMSPRLAEDLERADDNASVTSATSTPAGSFLPASQSGLIPVTSPAPMSPTSRAAAVWGNLISQYPHQAHCALNVSSFSIGRNPRCQLQLRDPVIPPVLCKLHAVSPPASPPLTVSAANAPLAAENTQPAAPTTPAPAMSAPLSVPAAPPSASAAVSLEPVGAMLEVCSASGQLAVNGEPVRKGQRVPLHSGDELTIVGSLPYAFIFQQVQNSGPAAPLASSSASALAAAAPAGEEPLPRTLLAQASDDSVAKLRWSDTSVLSVNAAAATAASSSSPSSVTSSTSVAASLAASTALASASAAPSAAATASAPSSASDEPNIMRPPPTTAEYLAGLTIPGVAYLTRSKKRTLFSEEPALSPAVLSGATANLAAAVSANSAHLSAPTAPATTASSSTAKPPAATIEWPPTKPVLLHSLPAAYWRFSYLSEAKGEVKITSTVDGPLVTPLLPAIASSVPNAMLLASSSGPIPAAAIASAVGTAGVTAASISAVRKQLLEDFTKSVLAPQSHDVRFDKFPYYLSEDTKRQLINSAYVYLRRPEFAKHTKDLPSVSRRILLSGPAGTEVYQETLVKALAAELCASLFIFDPTKMLLAIDAAALSPSTSITAALPAAAAAAAVPSASTEPIAGRARLLSPLHSSDISHAVAAAELLDAEPTATTATSPSDRSWTTRRMFRKGDRVRYIGSGNALLSASMGRSAGRLDAAVLSAPSATASGGGGGGGGGGRRGPVAGARGKVLMTFDTDNPRKVGVKFDRPVYGGTNLNGLCDDGFGFFVETSELIADGDSGDHSNSHNSLHSSMPSTSSSSTNSSSSSSAHAHHDLIALDALCELVQQESVQPLIVFVRDLERILAYESQSQQSQSAAPSGGSSSSGGGGGGGGTSSSTSSQSSSSRHSSGYPDVALARLSQLRRLFEKLNGTRCIVIGGAVSADARARSSDRPSSMSALLSKTSGGSSIASASGGGSNSSPLFDFSIIDHFSRMEERSKETSKLAKLLNKLFPTRIALNPPTEPVELARWRRQIERDVEGMKFDANAHNLKRLLEKNHLEMQNGVPPAEAKLLKETVLTNESLEKAIAWALSHQSMHRGDAPQYRSNHLVLSDADLLYGLQSLAMAQPELGPPQLQQKLLREVDAENEFEKRLLSEVIPPNEIGVRFEDVGALDSVKETLRELVMLPLQRPELFRKGNLSKPCKGILMFGPPGTGKTMLAKAVATESGANFINVSMSTIASKWFGEGERYARAVFTLASKISPCVIFIDEVDSLLGKRERPGEHEAMRKIKNEIMACWDGLKTRESERVLVLGATNRPFDLDDAVLRRMPRRLLIDLPDAPNREKILRVILSKEELEPMFDFGALASSTEGYSGSDLSNLCIAAAYVRIREVLEKEKREKQRTLGEPQLRPITLADFDKAKQQISASVSEDAFAIAELRKWNEQFGEGGNRLPQTLSYFM